MLKMIKGVDTYPLATVYSLVPQFLISLTSTLPQESRHVLESDGVEIYNYKPPRDLPFVLDRDKPMPTGLKHMTFALKVGIVLTHEVDGCFTSV